MRKKQQESELQEKLTSYTKCKKRCAMWFSIMMFININCLTSYTANEALKKQNQELQDMLDLARYQVANLGNEGTIQPIEIPGHYAATSDPQSIGLDPLTVPSSIAVSIPEISVPPAVNCNIVQLKRASEVSTDVSEFIDVLLESDDWAVNKEEDVINSSDNEISDEGSDHLDLLLENDFWLEEGNEKKNLVHQSSIISPDSTLKPPVQVVSPVLSLSMKTANHQLPQHLSRKEKNRIHARNRRMKVKIEHAKLKQSVDAYTQCKFESVCTENL